MPLPNTLLSYEDVAADLNAILEQGGGRRVCTSANAATQWRHRANKYRALLREQGGSTPFDHFAFRITAQEPHVVVVAPMQMGGHIETSTGKRLEPVKNEDELLDEAKRLAKELGLDE